MTETQPLNSALKNIFRDLSNGPKAQNTRLVDKWNQVVGENVAKKTTPRFQNSGVVVWVENSSLACELSQVYSAAILKRLQNEFGENEVKKIWFRVGDPR